MIIKLLLFLVKRLPRTFGLWQQSEKVRREALELLSGDITKLSSTILGLFRMCLPVVPEFLLQKLYWRDFLYLFTATIEHLKPSDLPILKPGEKSSDVIDWDYPNRPYIYSVHTLAQTYGWKLEYINKLDLDVALALLQEIWTEEQLNKEFVYSLSEVAYPYNSTTKQSRFKPLPRPYWMWGKVKQVKTFKIKKDLLPQGSGNDEMAAELIKRFKEFQDKKAKPS